jgi:type II secretory pathway component PulF
VNDTNDERPHRLSPGETGEVGAVLSTLVQAGFPLAAGLDAAARELPRGKLARSLAGVSLQLQRGQTLDAAIAAQGRALPEHARALVAAGLRTARLGEVLEEFVAIQRRTADIRRAVFVSLAYPMVLLMVLLAVFSFFAIAVVPDLTRIFDDFDLDLPMASQILIGISGSGLWVLMANLAVVACGWIFAWLSSEVAEVRSMMQAAPLVGPISRWVSLAQFSRLMALLVESELPLPAALILAGRGSQDADLAGGCLIASRRIEGGRALAEALGGLTQFPKTLGPMVAWGERTNALPEACRTAAEMFEGRLEAQLALVRALVGPFAFLAVLWGIFFLLAATLVPLISLIDKLS